MDGTFRLPYGLPKDKGLPTVPPRLYLEDEDFQPKDKGLPMLPPRLYLEDGDLQSRLPKEDKGLPMLPPRLYLEDEDFQPKDKGLPMLPPRLYLEDGELQSRLPKEDKGLPMLPPRLYLEDEDFTSQLHDNTKQNTASNFQEKAVCFQVCGSVIQTHELQSPTVNENVYQPLLPNRRVTQESSESTVYQPITPGGTTNHKEEKEKWTRLATGIKNSTYQSHTFKSPARNGEQNQDKRGQLISAKESSERCTNHYQPLVFSKRKTTPAATH